MNSESRSRLSLKIDVDTHEGMKRGVPALLEILDKFGIPATFCLSFGPDNAGKAIFRLLKDPQFFKKMLRTGAPRLYGLRTVLSGTILPPRPIAMAFPEIVRQIDAQGHEVIVHAWDHRTWQDHLSELGQATIRGELEKAFQAFRQILGRIPRAVAAPGWQATCESLAVQDALDLLYASDIREGPPCFLRCDRRTFNTVQIPTTGPCIEELMALGVRDEKKLSKALLKSVSAREYPVLAVHAEVEGGPFRSFFEGLLGQLLYHFEAIVPLEDVANHLMFRRGTLSARELVRITLPGRAGKVASSR